MTDVSNSFRHEPAEGLLKIFVVDQNEHDRYGIALSPQVAQCQCCFHRHLGQNREHGGVARQAIRRLQYQLSKRQTVGQLDSAQSLANELELLDAAARRDHLWLKSSALVEHRRR